MSGRRSPVKAWLAHYSELIGSWCRRPAANEDAQDAMQDAVVRILENGAAQVEDPLAYLKGSVRNGLIDRHRRSQRTQAMPLHELEEDEHPLAGSVEAHVRAARLAHDLAAALEELSLPCRQVYIRHRLEGWTHAEIARSLGISRDMVEKHMTRALKHLNARLQKYAP